VRRRVALAGLCLLTALAAPAAGGAAPATSRIVRAVVLSDFNGPYGSTTYSAAVTRTLTRITDVWRPDIVLSAGDMVAGQKAELPDTRFPAMWQAFDAAIGAPLRKSHIPFGFALGNHDASASRTADGIYRFARERDHAAVYWRDPAHRPQLDYVDARHFPFAYSFMFGGIFFVSIDASTHVIQEAPWVLTALRGPGAGAARMRIVLGHLPLYGISEGRSRRGDVIEDGERWREIFEANRIDVYISGHHAAYYPAHRGRLRLLHSGGGADARRYMGYPEVPARPTVTLVQIDLRTRGVALEAYDVSTGEGVELDTLPRCINGYNGPVFRIDRPQEDRCPPQSRGR
jgi:hypothetical protein